MVSQRLTASVESAMGLEECLVGKPRLHGLWSLRALSTHQSLPGQRVRTPSRGGRECASSHGTWLEKRPARTESVLAMNDLKSSFRILIRIKPSSV